MNRTKAFKSDRNVKSGTRPASQTSTNKSSKGKESQKKRILTSQSNSSKAETTTLSKYSVTEPQELKKVVDKLVESRVRELVSNQSLEIQKTSIEVSINKTIKNRSHSTKRPASSRSSNKTLKKEDEIRRSSQFERRDKENSRFGKMLQEEMYKTEESKKELEKRTKQIIAENLKKYHGNINYVLDFFLNNKEQIKIEEEKQRKLREEKELEKKRIAEINKKIKEKNKLRVDSGSPVKHKYGWGADQKRLDMKPQSKDSGAKWQKKESPKRREELGLGYLNKLDENSIKKVKEGKNKFIINLFVL